MDKKGLEIQNLLLRCQICGAGTGTTERTMTRPYLESHPWISFRLDLNGLPWRFWELIGEARSKCRHLAFSPLPPVLARELSTLYLAKGAHATTAIEGNSLTEEQALEVVQGQLRLPASQEYLKREIENILEATQQLERDVFENRGFAITPELLRSLNRSVLDDLEVEDHVEPGEYRTGSVVVGGVYRGAPAQDCDYLVQRLCRWLNGPDFRSDDDPREGFLRAVLRAAVAHIYIAWIHPFGDGNGRTARLVEFGILTAAGVPTVAAHLLSNHYNATRGAYYRQLDIASRSGGDLGQFLQYGIAGFVDELQEQLNRVHGTNVEAAWTVYVHGTFGADSTPATRRQRDLVLALPSDGWTARSDIRSLTPKLAHAYAAKGEKTVTRDINALVKRGLVAREGRQVRARREIMLGFRPPVAAPLVMED